MKKNILNTSGSLLFVFLLFAGCQKQINEPAGTTDQQIELQKDLNDRYKNKCRLVNLDWSAGGGGVWQYSYNNRGLADKWTIDYGDGFIISEEIYYNAIDQIIKADEDYFGSNYVYHFYYASNRLTRVTRASVDFPDQFTDFRYTYNNRGQNTRQDDDINDEHVLMYYDVMGNCTKTDIYLGSDLWYSDNYTFNTSVKNPWAHVPGIKIGFLSYGGTYPSNKRWFTSNRTVIYDIDGTPLVFNDYDPSQTAIQTNINNLPTSTSYYDRVTESPLTITLGYDNCGRSNSDDFNHHVNQSATRFSPDNIKIQAGRILHGPVKDKKEKISELRKQLKK